MYREIEIKDEAQVEKINQLACETPYEVWLSSGSIMLDARSLLGLFALVGKKAHVVVEDYVTPPLLPEAGHQDGPVTPAPPPSGAGACTFSSFFATILPISYITAG